MSDKGWVRAPEPITLDFNDWDTKICRIWIDGKPAPLGGYVAQTGPDGFLIAKLNVREIGDVRDALTPEEYQRRVESAKNRIVPFRDLGSPEKAFVLSPDYPTPDPPLVLAMYCGHVSVDFPSDCYLLKQPDNRELARRFCVAFGAFVESACEKGAVDCAGSPYESKTMCTPCRTQKILDVRCVRPSSKARELAAEVAPSDSEIVAGEPTPSA